MEQNHLCYFGRRYYRDDSYEIILKFEPVVKEMLFKILLFLALVWSRTV